MNLILLLFSVVAFTVFTFWVARKYGVQFSISASINVLQGVVEKSFYSWFIIGIALPIMIINDSALGFWAGAFLMIDAAAVSTSNNKIQMILHCLGADVGMVLGLILLITFGLWWLVVLAIIASGLLLLYADNSTWWIETTVFITVIIGMFIEKV